MLSNHWMQRLVCNRLDSKSKELLELMFKANHVEKTRSSREPNKEIKITCRRRVSSGTRTKDTHIGHAISLRYLKDLGDRKLIHASRIAGLLPRLRIKFHLSYDAFPKLTSRAATAFVSGLKKIYRYYSGRGRVLISAEWPRILNRAQENIRSITAFEPILSLQPHKLLRGHITLKFIARKDIEFVMLRGTYSAEYERWFLRQSIYNAGVPVKADEQGPIADERKPVLRIL
jgi:hypothetical protein